jgi:hypothetical protein
MTNEHFERLGQTEPPVSRNVEAAYDQGYVAAKKEMQAQYKELFNYCNDLAERINKLADTVIKLAGVKC